MQKSSRLLRSSKFGLRRASLFLQSGLSEVTSSRFFWQIIISFAIFLVVLGATRVPLKAAGLFLQGVAYTVGDDYDFVAAAKNLPSVDQVRTNYLQQLIDWLKNSRPISPGPAKEQPLWPVDGQITSQFGWRPDPTTKQETLHEGIDIDAKEGTPIRAVLSGVVASVRESPTYGKVVEIDHGGGLLTLYAHCSEIMVPQSARVKQGDIIGRVGKTGNATQPNLHLEVIENGRPVDPMKRLLEGGA